MQKTFHIYENFYLGFVALCFCGGGICFCSFTGALRSPWASILPNLEKRRTALLITSVAVAGHVLLLQRLTIAFLLLEAALTARAGRGCHCQVYNLPNLLDSAFSPKLQTSDAQVNLLLK